ncbi:hypothetical protein K1719_005517 [Acacia pycnantha]|nr:hypothetical protein K1719_005517 [Acacia pycnantha]
MAKIRGNRVSFVSDRLVLTTGATSANEILMFCLVDPGEAFLLPTLYYPACNVCFELYPFYQSEAASVPPTNPTASQGKSGIPSETIVAIVVPISVAVLILVVGICCLSKRIRKKYDSESTIGIRNLDSLQYDFSTIEAATNNFSADNKLNPGGFGELYKGTLANGQEIAVKRFFRSSRQDIQKFKNGVEVLANVQHRNLTLKRKKQLDWAKRYEIIKGIVQGILHLHEYSRLKIIHLNLKVSNILLDRDMNPKITNFGLARVCTVDQTQINVDCARGTIFGVLLMEIISGKMINFLYQIEDEEERMQSYAWRLWKEGEPLEFVDPTIRESCNPNEVMRCIHIALLCVQEHPTDRPSLSSIVIMLHNYSLTLPSPSDPLNFCKKLTEGEEDELSTSSMEYVYSDVS